MSPTKTNNAVKPFGALLVLALSLIIPSVGAVQKYTHAPGLVAYILFVVVALLIGYRYMLPWFLSTASERLSTWLAIVTFLCLIAVFAIMYPIANSGIVGGGTDRDEALNIAVQEFIHGRYPYYLRTYLNAPISPLPGSILLAMPFVLLGNSAYQNLFWIAAFYALIRWYFKDSRYALLLIWVVLGLAPIFWQELVTGGDLLANGLFVCIFTLIIAFVHQNSSVSKRKKIVAALLLGVGLSSRLNYLLVLLPLFMLLAQLDGWKSALKYTLLTTITTAIITLPFYIYDPAGFSPLHTLDKVNQFRLLLPFAGVVIVVVSGFAALFLSLRRMQGDQVAFLLACAIPQAVPIAFGLIFYTILRRLDYNFPGYGLSFLWFGVLAAWVQITRTLVLQPRPDAMKSPSPVLR